MHFSVVIVDATADFSDDDRRQQDPVLTQTLEGFCGGHALLQQHHIEGIPPLEQFGDGIGEGAQILQAIALALQPAGGALHQPRVRQQRSNGERRLGHGPQLGASRLTSVLTGVTSSGETRCLSSNCRGRPQ